VQKKAKKLGFVKKNGDGNISQYVLYLLRSAK